MKLAGKRILLHLTCSFNRFTDTPYGSAKSRSSITCVSRMVNVRDLIERSYGAGTTIFSFPSIDSFFRGLCRCGIEYQLDTGKVAM